MAAHQFVGHENPYDRKKKTPMDRARLAGLRPRFLAENGFRLWPESNSGEKFHILYCDQGFFEPFDSN